MGFCEHNNAPLGCKKGGKFLVQVSYYQLFMSLPHGADCVVRSGRVLSDLPRNEVISSRAIQNADIVWSSDRMFTCPVLLSRCFLWFASNHVVIWLQLECNHRACTSGSFINGRTSCMENGKSKIFVNMFLLLGRGAHCFRAPCLGRAQEAVPFIYFPSSLGTTVSYQGGYW